MSISNELIAIELMKMCNGDFNKKKKLVKAYRDFLKELKSPKKTLIVTKYKAAYKKKRRR